METNQIRDEIEIDIRELFMTLWSKKLLIILSGVAAALIAVFVSMFVLTKTYQSSTKVYMLNQQSSDMITYSDLQSGSQLTKDYQELIISRTVLGKVISNLNLNISYEDLAAMVSVEVITDTRILRITITSNDPYEAMNIANAVRKESSEQISRVMNIEAVNVIDEANLPDGPSGPSVKRNGMLGGIIGIMIAVLGALTVYIFDDTIKTPDDVEKYLGVGVLGSIPYNEKDNKVKMPILKNKKKEGVV